MRDESGPQQENTGEPASMPRPREITSLAEARKRAGYSQEQLAEKLSVELSTVGRWERRKTKPQPWIRPILAQALALSADELGDILAGTVQTSLTGPGEKPDQGHVAPIMSIGDYADHVELAATSPAEYLSQISVKSPIPNAIGWADVTHVQVTTQAVATSENLFGGGLSCEAALGQLQWAGKLLEARAANDVRKALFEAVGNLSSVVAFSAFDVSNYDTADRCFHFALWCAEQSGSWALRANTLAEMSRKAAYLGDLDSGLSLIEFAQVRADRLTATARAMLWTLRARLLALMGRHNETQDDVQRADAEFNDHDPAIDPPWLCYYDAAEHQGSTGKALIPVAAKLKEPEIATPRLNTAIHLHRDSYPRSRTFSRIRLADLLMTTADPREATEIGRQAVTEAISFRSKRILTELRTLARRSAPHSHIGDVAELRNDISALTLPND